MGDVVPLRSLIDDVEVGDLDPDSIMIDKNASSRVVRRNVVDVDDIDDED